MQTVAPITLAERKPNVKQQEVLLLRFYFISFISGGNSSLKSPSFLPVSMLSGTDPTHPCQGCRFGPTWIKLTVTTAAGNGANSTAVNLQNWPR